MRDKQYIKLTIEKVFGVGLDLDMFYENFFEKNLRHVFNAVPAELNLPPII
jgi:hypothetical protein